MTFIGKSGTQSASAMLERAKLRPGEPVLVFYGSGTSSRDQLGLDAIEAAHSRGARIAVVTDTDAERDFVLSLGLGDGLAGAVSIAEISRRVPHFVWPTTMPDLPDPKRQTGAFKEAVHRFTEDTFKPIGQAVGRILASGDNPRGVPSLVVERASRDSLAVSTMLASPSAGRVVYMGEMGGRRYSFYAPQVWMRQRRILMPTAEIRGTHLSNASEIAALNRMIAGGSLTIDQPGLVEWIDLSKAHQAMWENLLPEFSGGPGNVVVNHALPEAGLTNRDELYAAWLDPGD
jgi:acrylyl-CoA reductase (NADPH)/3-hydroxypropionyl-CoA dehydratase/3-hydroxypropionyl-CoA synthetase